MENQLTKAEKRTIATYGKDVCLAAYKQHIVGGSGACTIGELFLHGIVAPQQYTKSGDVLINAGRKIKNQSTN